MNASSLLLLFSGLLAGLVRAESVPLFDGTSLDAWQPARQGGWTIDAEGALVKAGPGDFLWTRESYGDFELDLEFNLSPGANSGVFFRTDPGNPVQGGFEIQLLDSAGKASVDKHDCGALYDAAAPAVNAVLPAGQWNRMRLTCLGPRITVVLNGQTVMEADLDQWTEAQKNPDGSKNKFKTALAQLPRTGKIGLQDHGKPVRFRNLRLTAP